MDYAKKLTLRCHVVDVDLPERRQRYASSREEEDVAINMCPCHVVGECKITRRNGMR